MNNFKISILSLVLGLFIPFSLKGQAYGSQYFDIRRYIGETQILDSVKLRITYSLEYIFDTTQPKKITKDRKILLIGKKINHFYSYYVCQSDSAITADFNQNKDSAPLKRPFDVLGEAYDIFTNYPSGSRTIIESITSEAIYKYEEPLDMPKWKITNEVNMILNYPCLKATTRFRGRDYEAWFTMSIPINSGPWKLGGLPGLILRAKDSNNQYRFDCIGIEQIKKKEAIVIPKWNYINTTRQSYRKTQKQYYDNRVNFLLSIGYNVFIVDDKGNRKERLSTPNKSNENRGVWLGTRVNARDRHKKTPYNTIELE